MKQNGYITFKRKRYEKNEEKNMLIKGNRHRDAIYNNDE